MQVLNPPFIIHSLAIFITYGSSIQPVKPGNIIKIGLLLLFTPSYFIQSKHTPLFPINCLDTDIL